MLVEGMPTGGFRGLQCESTPERGTELSNQSAYVEKHLLSNLSVNYKGKPKPNATFIIFNLDILQHISKDTISNYLLTVLLILNCLHWTGNL